MPTRDTPGPKSTLKSDAPGELDRAASPNSKLSRPSVFATTTGPPPSAAACGVRQVDVGDTDVAMPAVKMRAWPSAFARHKVVRGRGPASSIRHVTSAATHQSCDRHKRVAHVARRLHEPADGQRAEEGRRLVRDRPQRKVATGAIGRDECCKRSSCIGHERAQNRCDVRSSTSESMHRQSRSRARRARLQCEDRRSEAGAVGGRPGASRADRKLVSQARAARGR